MRLHRTTLLRTCAALLVAGGGLAAVAAPSSAATSTDPLAPVTQPLTGALAPLPTLPVPLPSAPSLPALPLPNGTSSTGSSSSTGSGSTAAATGTPSSATTTSSGSRTTTRSGSASTRAGSGSPQPAASVAADTPAASLCVFASSGSAPAFEVSAKALGNDLSSPLVERFPQAFAPCPAGAVPAGDHVAAVDAGVQGLLGACVRVTRQVVPVQTTLVVLDHDVIRELTAAGLPLQQLVVPCPAGSGSHTAGAHSSAPHGSSSLTQADQVSALSALGRLAFTGSDVLPTVLTGLGLFTLGALLVRASRVVPVRRRH